MYSHVQLHCAASNIAHIRDCKHSLTFGLIFHQILQQKMLTIILVHSEGSCLSNETNHARNSVQNVIFVFSKYHVMSFLCHHAENFCLRHFVPEVCRAIAICVDRNRIIANRLHVTIEYTFDLAVRNVERLNVSRVVTGVHMFQPRYYLS